jgi:hypothetical protein
VPETSSRNLLILFGRRRGLVADRRSRPRRGGDPLKPRDDWSVDCRTVARRQSYADTLPRKGPLSAFVLQV